MWLTPWWMRQVGHGPAPLLLRSCQSTDRREERTKRTASKRRRKRRSRRNTPQKNQFVVFRSSTGLTFLSFAQTLPNPRILILLLSRPPLPRPGQRQSLSNPTLPTIRTTPAPIQKPPTPCTQEPLAARHCRFSNVLSMGPAVIVCPPTRPTPPTWRTSMLQVPLEMPGVIPNRCDRKRPRPLRG